MMTACSGCVSPGTLTSTLTAGLTAGTPAPARNREGILTRLRAEAVEVAQHLLCPVGGELVMPILAGRKISVETSLAVNETRGERCELVVQIVCVHSGNGRRTGGCGLSRRATGCEVAGAKGEREHEKDQRQTAKWAGGTQWRAPLCARGGLRPTPVDKSH